MRHLSAFLIASLAFSPCGEAFDRGDWLADFEQIKTAINENYPNLEWAAERGLDLAAMERRARDRLDAASNDFDARVALERFVNNFGDGHVSLTWPARQPSVQSESPAPTTCKSLGYQESPDISAIARDLAGYQPLSPANGIDAGMLTIAGKRVAVLRVSLFLPTLAMCEVGSQEILRTKTTCDETCENEVERRSDNIFLRAIEDRLRELAGKHPDMLLLDVAGNGGGNDTAIALARMLGGRNLPTPAVAFVRNADRVRDLAENEVALESALRSATKTDAAFLKPLLAGLTDARQQASVRCDLNALWAGKPASCTDLVRGRFFAGGLVAEELPEQFRDATWADHVSTTARYRYTPGLWKTPVLVLVDGNSASATELIAAMLQDSGRAAIIGAPTFGAGCGWTFSKHAIELGHSGGQLYLPDCTRFRRDGRNELDGIQPDELVGFRRYDSPKQRAARLAPKLTDAVARFR
jgi:hypothetical protein